MSSSSTLVFGSELSRYVQELVSRARTARVALCGQTAGRGAAGRGARGLLERQDVVPEAYWRAGRGARGLLAAGRGARGLLAGLLEHRLLANFCDDGLRDHRHGTFHDRRATGKGASVIAFKSFQMPAHRVQTQTDRMGIRTCLHIHFWRIRSTSQTRTRTMPGHSTWPGPRTPLVAWRKSRTSIASADMKPPNMQPIRTSEELESYVGHLFDFDPVVKRLTRDIRRTQKRLQRSVDDEAWRIFLRLEAMTNHRHDEILEKVFARLAKGGTACGGCRRWSTRHGLPFPCP
jgi:hypothetical protein